MSPSSVGVDSTTLLNDSSNGSTSSNGIENAKHHLSLQDYVKGLVCFHLLAGIPLIVAICLLIGSCLYPYTIGLFVTIPYVTYTSFIPYGRHEMKYGSHDYNFSKNFIVFRFLRNYLKLQFITTTGFQKEIKQNQQPQVVADNQEHPKQQQHPEQQQYIFAVFPHGAYSDYRILMDGMLDTILPNQIATNNRTLAASILFRIPLIREIALATGCIDASRSVAERLLRTKRYSMMVLPGGEAEQIRSICGQERIYIKNRKGFIRLALKFNVPIVPIYVFGASDYYKTSSFLLSARLWLVKNLGICIPFATGACGTMVCPNPIPTSIVVGTPIRFTKDGHPIPTTTPSPNKQHAIDNANEIDSAHAAFCESLRNLFNEYKHITGYGDRELEMM